MSLSLTPPSPLGSAPFGVNLTHCGHGGSAAPPVSPPAEAYSSRATQESRVLVPLGGVRGERRRSPRGLLRIPDAGTEPSREAKAE
jgi:hypothetical protein